MKIISLILLISVLFSMNLYSQLASWSLTVDGNPTAVATNVNAGIFINGSGLNTLSFSSSGASCSGWTSNNSPDTADYFQITIAPASGFKLKISTIAFSERRSLTGIRMYELRVSKSADFSTYTTLSTVNVPDNDQERDGTINGLNLIVNSGETLFIRWYGYQAEGGSGTWRINDNSLSLDGTVTQTNPNDNDSYASEPTLQVAGDTISSVRTNAAMAKKVFSFVLNDAGSTDGLPTKVSFISIKNKNNANWLNLIKGAFLKVNGNSVNAIDTTINQNSISFSFTNGALLVPNGSNVNIDLYIFLKDSAIVDSTILQFLVDSTCFDSYITGSGFASSFPQVVSNTFVVDVVGRKINLLMQPSFTFPGIEFTLSGEVTDLNGNLDLSYTGNIQVELSTGSGTLQSASGLSVYANNGMFIWTDLTYSDPGIYQMLIKDLASQLIPAYSNFIYSIIPPTILNDNFSDGDFTQNPTWVGSTGDFIVNTSYELALNTVASGSINYSYLTTPVKLLDDSIEWQALIKLNFNPSSNNNVKYYLMSNSSDLTQPLKGYYLLFGEDGSSDAIKLYYTDSTNNQLLATCNLGGIAATPNVRVKVVRYNSGDWKIYADYVGGTSFILQATANDLSFYDSVVYTGIICKFSTTYATGKFFFDDFYTGPVQVDTIKPTLTDLRVLDSLHIDLYFSEGISLLDAQDVNNYVVNNNIGVPVSAVRDNLNPSIIHLTFGQSFISGQQYTIAFFNLHDFAGNMIVQPLIKNFIWYYVQPFDVLINEIMADPSPPVQLPEYEYLELYNRSAYTISLFNWTLKIGNNEVLLPNDTIPAGGYVILCNSVAVSALSSYGKAIPVLPSTSSLTNGGTYIALKSSDGRMIHFLTYSDSWYQSSFKSDGGWSLEQIDPMNPCGEASNWIASIDVRGGTPCAQNSVYKSNPDNTPPDILRAILIEPDTLILTFNEIIFGNDVLDKTNYIVDHNIGHPDTVLIVNQEQKKIQLIFNNPGFVKDTIYTLSITAGIEDCAGNINNTVLTANFAIGDSILPGSIIINEVLFYEPTGGSDYVELYNPTEHTFNLKDIKWAEVDETQQIIDLYEITSEGFYIFPKDYVVLTKSLKGVTEYYYTPHPKKILEMPTFPSLKSTSGRITFVNRSFEIIDDFSYDESMQFQLLNSFKGVALERIHPEIETQDAKNWHSAAESCGFGTPTYKNSQYALFNQSNGEITVEPEIFSPDMDGKDDVLNIHYKFNEPGYVANISIFDARGREIRRLIKNEMCGTEGYYTWDGLTDAKTKAEIGIYIVYVEVYNLNGKTASYKKTCVVGGHLK